MKKKNGRTRSARMDSVRCMGQVSFYLMFDNKFKKNNTYFLFALIGMSLDDLNTYLNKYLNHQI